MARRLLGAGSNDSAKAGAQRVKAIREGLGYDVMLRLNCFAAIVNAGGEPPREVLNFVARRFQRYIDAEGKLTLDEAFSLRSVQGAGNPAKRLARRIVLDSALADITLRMLTDQIGRKQAIDDFIAAHQLKKPEQDSGDAAWYGGTKVSKSVLEQEAKTLRARDMAASLERAMTAARSSRKRAKTGK